MNVLNLISVPWYNSSAHYALTCGLALREKGAQVWFGGMPGSPVLQKATQEGFGLVTAGNLKSFNPLRFLASLRSIVRCIRNNRIDLVISHRGEDRLAAALAWSVSTLVAGDS